MATLKDVADLAGGYGTVELPYALARKYPNAEREWMWQYVFPSEKHSVAQILLTTGAAFSATASRLLTHYSVTARPRPINRRSVFSTASPPTPSIDPTPHRSWARR